MNGTVNFNTPELIAERNGEESAFPIPGMQLPNEQFVYPSNGLTKREEFAKCFMASLLTDPKLREGKYNFAYVAVNCADALLKELAK